MTGLYYFDLPTNVCELIGMDAGAREMSGVSVTLADRAKAKRCAILRCINSYMRMLGLQSGDPPFGEVRKEAAAPIEIDRRRCGVAFRRPALYMYPHVYK